MNKRVLFSLLLILLIVITTFNVYVQRTASNEKLQAEIHQLQKEKQQMITEKNALKQTIEQQDPSKIQKHHHALVNQVSAFVKTGFVQDKETYQERKKKANKIMSKDLVDTFFPTDSYKGETKTSVDNVEIFIKTGNLSNNHATVLIRLKHTLYSLKYDQQQTSSVFIKVKVQRQEGDWIITEFKNIGKDR